MERPPRDTRGGSPTSAGTGWWHDLSSGIKGLITALVGGILLAVITGPLSPILSDAGSVINPFERNARTPKITVVQTAHDPIVGWVIPKEFEQIGKLPANGDLKVLDAWATKEGAVKKGTTLDVGVQGGPRAALITSLEITVTARRSPLSGIYVFQGGGGSVPPRGFEVDLDDPAGPLVRAYVPTGEDEGDSGDPGVPVDFPYWVSETEWEYLRIDVYPSQCDCEWIGTLHWIIDGVEGETQITDGGKPFRVTGVGKESDRAVLSCCPSTLRRLN